MTTPVLERVRRGGSEAELVEPIPRPDVEALMAAVREAAEAPSRDEALSHWAGAGELHDLETLDAVIGRLAGGLLARLSGRRGRLAASARMALEHSESVGAVQLAAALVGELGGSADAAVLEELAIHPTLTLHAATALGNLRSTDGVESLLRLLHGTEGESRVLVVDRLLAHVRQPAVRIALVRDALVGLPDQTAAELAPWLADACDAAGIAADERRSDDVRRGARRVVELAGRRSD